MWAQKRHEQAISLAKDVLVEAQKQQLEPLLVPQLRTLLGKWQSTCRQARRIKFSSVYCLYMHTSIITLLKLGRSHFN